jgi:MerR family transcriptional regulator, light-induced transcriptional regulator
MEAKGLNISALARRTGVAPDTLRKWEQRYAVLRPGRTGGGQRRYTEADVARIEWLQARLGEGYRIGEAAALLGGEETAVTRSPGELRAAILEAAERGDGEAAGRLLDQCFALSELEDALTDVVAPLLREVGERWESGRFSVAQEHLVSGTVRTRLDRLLADARGSVRGVAVLACAPGEHHELGLLMVAVMLRADGWQVGYLGPDTPFADALALAEVVDARVLGLSVGMTERLEQLESQLRGRRLPHGLTLVLGGRGVDEASATRLGADYVDTSLRSTVTALRRLAA